MHKDCNEIYPPGYERELAQKTAEKGGWANNRGSLVESFVYMEELSMNQEAVPGGRLNFDTNTECEEEYEEEEEEEEEEDECEEVVEA